MNPSTYIPMIFLLIIIFVMLRNRKAVVARKIIKNRKERTIKSPHTVLLAYRMCLP